MTVPDPRQWDARPPSSPDRLGDPVPDPLRPDPRGRPVDPTDPRPPDPSRPDRQLHLTAVGRDDRYRHAVDVTPGELGDPQGLRARCGAPVERVASQPGTGAPDCPTCAVSLAVPSA